MQLLNKHDIFRNTINYISKMRFAFIYDNEISFINKKLILKEFIK